ncbi:MAG TPA: zinc-binding alcohol dehydrogenase family protein [Sporichthyaceae bacterium]|jgi:NADPH:quinone reductase-like Zn-dependent oxidoreductase|nr:zinc-binding alcohol dehydrogenase family protein [Sporichthyaceae bacterium]
MRALLVERFGGPDVLRVAEVPDPQAGDGQAVVAVTAASINPSDLKNVAGLFPETTLPRVPGRDFAGVVVDGPPEWLGVEVWGTGGDIGFTRDGSHAQLLSVPVAALVAKPRQLSFEQAAAVGVNFVTAWLGAVEAASLAAGETIAVFGVSGGVGGAVAQIADSLGAHVLGVDRVQPAADAPAASVLKEFVPFDGADPKQAAARIRELTGGRGVDVAYDAVGGVTTPAALAGLARRGRLAVISATGTRTVQIDLIDLYREEISIHGCNSVNHGLVESAGLLARLAPFFDSGRFRPLPIARTYRLEDAGSAYQAVADGIRGRVVICP